MSRLPALSALVLLALAASGARATPTRRQQVVEAFSPSRVRNDNRVVEGKFKWWQHGIIYQIYPRSFKDSTGDGDGDLKGITEKLDYLKDLGVAAIWLSPIYKSPDKDMGYDISDFRDIHERYGTMDDFNNMVKEAHKKGLKVMLDFVPNHSSDEHKWFENAKSGPNSTYKDYYVWKEGKGDNKTEPPNNWRTLFYKTENGSAWTYVEEMKMFYLHQFHEGQPDLNYRNESLAQEMIEIFRFWIRKGVDGFRIDAITCLFEDKEFTDNPGYETTNTENLDETYGMVQRWRKMFEEESELLDKDLVMVLEAYADVPQTMKYFGTVDKPAGHFPFNFFIVSNVNENSTATNVNTEIRNWIDNLPPHGWANWVVGNHDRSRVGTRMGPELIDAMNMLVLLMPGTAVTYYGEELGMEDNPDLKACDCRDPMACPWKDVLPGKECNATDDEEKFYEENSRDYERTPFQWDDNPNAGFSTNDTIWLPVNKNFKNINVKNESAVLESHLNTYKKLVALRKERIFSTGDLKTEVEKDVLLFSRNNGTDVYRVLINFGKTEASINLTDKYPEDVGLDLYVSSNKANVNNETAKLTAKLPAKSSLVLRGKVKEGPLKWWQTGIIYQIYPRSFKDSDGDGHGDIPGITSKLQYLKDLGVTGVWLSPIYASPNKDMGYDISNFTDIHPDFGTMDDFEEFTGEAHRLGLKVLLDFVPNHSSDEHPWFEDVLKDPQSKYKDYYVWKNGTGTDKKNPPNKWRSVFKSTEDGSAWTYNENVGQFYLHQFHAGQPDLNYRNKNLSDAIKDTYRFWIHKGVDGFRVDAIPFLFEDKTLAENSPGTTDKTQNQPETYDMVQQWRKVFDEEAEILNKELVMIVEAYADVEKTMLYFGDDKGPGAHFPFNFFLIEGTKYEKNPTASKFKEEVEKWLDNVPEAYGWSNWVMGNHDQHRIGSRLRPELIDAINMLVLLMPGTAITYYGEEIGMVDNTDLHLEDCKDLQACPEGSNEEYYQRESRDFERTPFQWDDSENAGFSTNKSTWLKVNKDFKETNVKSEAQNENSHLSVYKKVAALRDEPAIQKGELRIRNTENVFSFSRKYHESIYIVLFNLGNKNETFDVLNEYKEYKPLPQMEVYVAYNYKNPCINLQKVELKPSAAVVLVPGSCHREEPTTTTTTTTESSTSDGETTTQEIETTTSAVAGLMPFSSVTLFLFLLICTFHL